MWQESNWPRSLNICSSLFYKSHSRNSSQHDWSHLIALGTSLPSLLLKHLRVPCTERRHSVDSPIRVSRIQRIRNAHGIPVFFEPSELLLSLAFAFLLCVLERETKVKGQDGTRFGKSGIVLECLMKNACLEIVSTFVIAPSSITQISYSNIW